MYYNRTHTILFGANLKKFIYFQEEQKHGGFSEIG